MEGIDCAWLRAMVVGSLGILAAPASTQIVYVRTNRFHHDELALGLDDVLEAFLTNCEPSKGATLALRALDRQLAKMSGANNAALWTDEGLERAQEWITCRRFAAKSLAELQERPVPTHSLPPAATARTPPTSKESAIYGLVLRHTVQVGHGWGKQPSPLRGFYVLDRIIDGVEDPSFDMRVLDDPKAGNPLSHELIDSLSTSVQDLGAIDFVPGLLELVDLQSTEFIHVRGQRGFVALGPIRESDRSATVGVLFHAGGRWSRSIRYEIVERSGSWGITKFQTLMIS